MYDYLIIGQGLAGTILSYQLIKQGKRVLVLNKHDASCSSYIAAGIFGPIAGQRIAKIWRCDEALPYMHAFYPEFEQALHAKFFYPMPHIKLLIDPTLEAYAATRMQKPEYEPWMQKKTYSNYKALSFNHAGYVDIPTLLDAYRQFLINHDAYQEELFDEAQLQLWQDHVTYKSISAKMIIFCNGLAAKNSRLFTDLAFNPTKGEIITIKADLPQDAIISGHVFILPIGNKLFQAGATFERDFKDAQPSPEGKQWLIEELEKIIDTPYEIVAHKAGIRPTTLGHKPYTYWHQQYQHVGIFSGFGSKGVSLIPLLVDEFSKN